MSYGTTYDGNVSRLISVTAGSDQVTFSGTVLTEADIDELDTLSYGGYLLKIESVDDDATITLKTTWPGGTPSPNSSSDWCIVRDSPLRLDAVEAAGALVDARNFAAILRARADVYVVEYETSTPPVSPAPEEGAYYLVGATPSGWGITVNEGDIAKYTNGSWGVFSPEEGNGLIDKGAEQFKTFNGTSWAANGVAGDVVLTSMNGGPLGGFRNLLINPMGRINQRALASNADDTYGHDRWNVLTQTGAVAVSTLSDVENGLPSMMRMTQSQASAQRMGPSQIIEALNCKHLRGKPVTLSGRVRCSAAATLRYAILEWTGTADSVTSDVVNDWTSSTYTAGNFFLGSNLTVAAVGSLALSANTLTDLTALTGTLGSSMNNLLMFLWTEGTVAQNVTLDYALQLEQGTQATPREVRSYVIEEHLCQRYFQDVIRGTNNAIIPGYGAKTSGLTIDVPIYLPVPMRATPTISHSSPAWYSTAPGTNNGVAFFDFIDSYATITGALAVILNGFTRIGGFIRFAAGTSFSTTTGHIGLLYVGATNISLVSEL